MENISALTAVSGNVAAALAGQTAWSWQNIDLLLRNTASWW